MRVSINQVKEMKQRGEKIAMLTAYDYATAKMVDEVGVPLILVGDSLGMVVLGYESTIPVTLEEMLHHTKAVVRGTKRATAPRQSSWKAASMLPIRCGKSWNAVSR